LFENADSGFPKILLVGNIGNKDRDQEIKLCTKVPYNVKDFYSGEVFKCSDVFKTKIEKGDIKVFVFENK